MRRALLFLLCLPLAAAAAEVSCALVQDRAYPHLNVYVPDTTLGARLEPGATTRLAFAGNPTTDVRINAQGYRGADWTGGDVLVVGDSQVFGLGVEEGQTATAVLGQALGRVALNGGVPTYGPDEYLAVVSEVLAGRQVKDVVLVLNAANDFFELSHPNTERHRIVDGWAVRAELAPEAGADFPGRTWLYQRSHAFLAWRRWRNEALPTSLSVPSEGVIQDLLPIERAHAEARAAADVARRNTETNTVVTVAQEQLRPKRTQADVDAAIAEALVYSGALDSSADETLGLMGALRGANPGDIVHDQYAEGGRSVAVSAQMLERGAALRRSLRAKLESWVDEHPEAKDDTTVQMALDAKVAGPEDTGHVRTIAPIPAPTSPMHDLLVRAKAITDAHGAALTMVVLPIDVQVSSAEFAKYGARPFAVDESVRLLDDVAVDAAALGLRVVRPMEALRAAEPGAFLDGDLHLSPKGQRVLGEQIAATLQGPPPIPLPAASDQLPTGRTRIPTTHEWDAVEQRASATGCSQTRIREWVRLLCPMKPADLAGVTVTAGPRETWVRSERDRLTVQFPDLGRAVDIDLFRGGGGAHLRWEGGVTTLARSTTLEYGPATQTVQHTCPGVYADLDACASTEDVCGCAEGLRTTLPSCAWGEANAGASGHCYALCDATRPCAAGVCTEWLGTGVCL